MFSHQDLKEIVISSKKQVIKKNIVKKKSDTSVNDQLKKIENDTEHFAHTKIPDDIRKKITSARIMLKLTQKEVANKLNIQLNVYTELENGKAIYSAETKKLINKLKTILNIVL